MEKVPTTAPSRGSRYPQASPPPASQRGAFARKNLHTRPPPARYLQARPSTHDLEDVVAEAPPPPRSPATLLLATHMTKEHHHHHRDVACRGSTRAVNLPRPPPRHPQSRARDMSNNTPHSCQNGRGRPTQDGRHQATLQSR
jgi:hypothetical protein